MQHMMNTEVFKSSNFDITVTQMGSGLYSVSGKGAKALYDKLQQQPAENNGLLVGEWQNDTFTLQKMAMGAAGNAAMTTATAG